MTTTTARHIPTKDGTFFARHAWKILLGVIVLIGFFGISDMFGGASDLQKGEKVYMTGFRKGERWAWVALWALPLWMLLTVFFVSSVEKQPGAGTPVPVISGSVLFVISASMLLLSSPRFFRKGPISVSEKQPNT